MMSASIVIPSFNRPQLIERSVSSATHQSVDCEVVVVDSSQPALNPELLYRLGREGQVRYVRFEPDVTLLQWSVGIAYAKGDACMILADDDWLEPRFLERTLPPLENPNVGYSISAAKVSGIENSVGKYSLLIQSGGPHDGLIPSEMWENTILGGVVATSPHAAIFRRMELLHWLPVNPLPGVPQWFKYVGCDMLITLLPLKKYPQVAYCAEPLVNFGAWTGPHGSITTGAVEANQIELLRKQYDAVKTYYRTIKPLL